MRRTGWLGARRHGRRRFLRLTLGMTAVAGGGLGLLAACAPAPPAVPAPAPTAPPAPNAPTKPAAPTVAPAPQTGIGLPEAKRIEAGKPIWRINAEEVFQVGIIATGPAVYGVRIAKTNLRNVPGRVINATTVKSPGNSLPQTFYFG